MGKLAKTGGARYLNFHLVSGPVVTIDQKINSSALPLVKQADLAPVFVHLSKQNSGLICK